MATDHYFWVSTAPLMLVNASPLCYRSSLRVAHSMSGEKTTLGSEPKELTLLPIEEEGGTDLCQRRHSLQLPANICPNANYDALLVPSLPTWLILRE